MGRAIDLIARTWTAPGDSLELRARKSLFVLAAILVIPAGVVWGLIYLATGEPVAAAIPLSYAVLSSAALALFARWHRFGLFRTSQLALILLLPFSLQLALAGFIPSSGVILWSVLAPIGAIVFGAPHPGRWLAAFVASVVVAGLTDRGLREANDLPPWLVTTFFVLNIATISTIAVTLLALFERQKDEAQRRSEELLLNILPAAIAERLKAGERRIADAHDEATVIFADIVGSTRSRPSSSRGRSSAS